VFVRSLFGDVDASTLNADQGASFLEDEDGALHGGDADRVDLGELRVGSLRRRQALQEAQKEKAGSRWREQGLVFTTTVGTALDAANVRRTFRRTVKAAGLDPAQWSPRELRHSFVSLLSDDGVSLETIAPLVGHAGTSVTEKVYRHQLRPVLLTGAVVMDRILAGPGRWNQVPR